MIALGRLLFVGTLVGGAGLGYVFGGPSQIAKITSDDGVLSVRPMAGQREDNSSDREITRRIRRDIVEDKGLSVYAHNTRCLPRVAG